jgi:hypothetical protein
VGDDIRDKGEIRGGIDLGDDDGAQVGGLELFFSLAGLLTLEDLRLHIRLRSDLPMRDRYLLS